MLHILLMILKIIGIILLAILGILILLLLIVLFVPLRYQITLESKGDLKTTRLLARFSWLLYLISGQAVYENEEFSWKLRLAWKTLSEGKEQETLSQAAEEAENAAEKVEEAVETESEEESESAKDTQAEKNEPEKESSATEEKSSSKETQEKSSKIEKIKYTIQSFCDKIKQIIEFLEGEAHLAAFGRLKKEVFRLLQFLKPKKIQGNIRFGTDDPYLTGQILAGLSILYPFYGEHVQIYPDFEEKVIEGDLFIRGQIRGIYAVILVWNMVFDKHVRATFKDIKTLL